MWALGVGVLCAACNRAPDNRVPPWPEWALHHWVWEDESTQESALALVDGYLERDIPVGAIIIDSPWATGYSTYDWDPELFPNPQGMVDDLHDRGVRVFIWTVPGFNLDAPGGLYEEAADKGYFMQSSESSGPAVVDWWKGQGSLIDYFNEDAVAWQHGLVDKTLALGIDGWKCDGLDFSAALASYSPGAGQRVERIDYSHAYYRDFFDYTRSVLGEDRLITARPVDNYGAQIGGEGVSFAPIDINWAGWVGDQDPTFSGLRAALNNLYHSSSMGYVNHGSDIGGYRSDDSALGRDRELFIRWAQQGAFSPVMENGGSGEHRPWMFDEETTDIYRTFTRLHYAMIPYLMEEGATAYEEGRALMRFVNDVSYAYHLGPDVFVAPVLEAGGELTVVFPEGSTWVYLFDPDTRYQGGEEVPFTVPLDEFPVFLKEGSEMQEILTASVAL